MAVDTPSGLDADTGDPGEPTFTADVTCTFVAAKTGLVAPVARPYVGELRVLDIGVPQVIVDQALEQAKP